ncbi:hypothetical protein FQR65_LT02645 [Abscondita terminalis]|nr:hypothetical protein FQR65_LT02645 [Abscondita terminalis]
MAQYFLDNSNEIQNHALIVRDNFKAMQEHTRQILNGNCYLEEPSNEQLLTIRKVIEEEGNIIQLQLNLNGIFSKLNSIRRKIREKEELIKHLEKELNTENEQYDKFKLEQEKLYSDNKTKLSTLQKAVKHFAQVFQYTIDTETLEDEDKYCVVIKFLVNKEESKYPIRFIFDRSSDHLLEFSASRLLSEEEHNALSNYYKENRNNVALLCALRNIVLARENI